MLTIELLPVVMRGGEATAAEPLRTIAASSALKVTRAIGHAYPTAPYEEVEMMANEVIAKAIALPTVPIIAHGFIVRYLWDAVTSRSTPVDVFA